MKNTVVTPENVHQIVQALYENVKSNQHRLDCVEPMMKDMSSKVDKLNTLLVENGYASAVKEAAQEVKVLRTQFNDYKHQREESCPVSRRMERDLELERNRKNWTATILKVIFAGIGGLSTVIIIIQTLRDVM